MTSVWSGSSPSSSNSFSSCAFSIQIYFWVRDDELHFHFVPVNIIYLPWATATTCDTASVYRSQGVCWDKMSVKPPVVKGWHFVILPYCGTDGRWVCIKWVAFSVNHYPVTFLVLRFIHKQASRKNWKMSNKKKDVFDFWPVCCCS